MKGGARSHWKKVEKKKMINGGIQMNNQGGIWGSVGKTINQCSAECGGQLQPMKGGARSQKKVKGGVQMKQSRVARCSGGQENNQPMQCRNAVATYEGWLWLLKLALEVAEKMEKKETIKGGIL